jgi:hypothetical protein
LEFKYFEIQLFHVTATILLFWFQKIWKERINSVGHQFHQYKQNEKPPLTLNSLNTKNTTINDVGNPGPGLGQAQKCDGVKPLNGIPTLQSS